jgi:hypothetical protein
MKLANFGLPLTRGKNPSKATQKRKGSANKESVEVNDYQEDIAIQKHTQIQPFHLTFMAGIIRKCYGCRQAFSERYRNAPNDLMLKRYDHNLESPRLHFTTPLHLLAHACVYWLRKIDYYG